MVLLGMREEPWFESFFFGSLSQQVASQVEGPTLLTKSRSASRSGARRLWNGLRGWLVGSAKADVRDQK